MYKIIVLSILFLNQNTSAASLCDQVTDLQGQLTQCNSQLSLSQTKYLNLTRQSADLIRLINDPSKDQSLRTCQNQNRDLFQSLQSKKIELSQAQNELARLNEMQRDLRQYLRRAIDYYECVVMEKKFATTRLFQGRTAEDALGKAAYSDIKDMIRKNGSYSYCYAVYNAENNDAPTPGPSHPGPGRPDDGQRQPPPPAPPGNPGNGRDNGGGRGGDHGERGDRQRPN